MSKMKKYIAKKELHSEDWKTQYARRFSNIPEGAEVEFLGMCTNFYGRYAKVRYAGNLYYVDINDLKIVEEKPEEKSEETIAEKIRCMRKVASATGQLYVDYEEVMDIVEGK